MRDSPSHAGTFPFLQAAAPLSQESLWRSINFFNLYRLILGGLLLLMAAIFGSALSLSTQYQSWFFWISAVYILLVLVSVLTVKLRKPRAGLQLAFQVCTDIAVVALLIYFSGGVQSNIGLLMLVSLATTTASRKSKRLMRLTP